MKKLSSFSILTFLFCFIVIGQPDPEIYSLPDICIPANFNTPFNDIELTTTCFDSSNKVTKNYESISKCRGFLTFEMFEIIEVDDLDRIYTDINERVIDKVLIYELEKLDDKYWVKRNFKFNGEMEFEFKVVQIEPLTISRTDSIDYLDEVKGEVYIGEIINYISFTRVR